MTVSGEIRLISTYSHHLKEPQKAQLQTAEKEKNLHLDVKKKASKGLTLSIIIILIISESSQLDLSSGKNQENRPTCWLTFCRRSSGTPRPFKSANNKSWARGLLRLYEHTASHEGDVLAAERRSCFGVEGSQRISRFQVGKPRPEEFLDCSNTPLEVGNLGSLCLAGGFSRSTAPSHPRQSPHLGYSNLTSSKSPSDLTPS